MPTEVGSADNTGNFAAALKEFYGPGLIGALNEDIPYFDALSSGGSEVELGGRGLVWPVHIKRSGGVGAIAENSTLPTAGTQTRTRATARAKEIYGRVELTRKVMAASRSNKMAFVDALDAEMNALESELKYSLNRQLLGNNVAPGSGGSEPDTGGLAVITTNGDSLTVKVDSTHQLHSGMKVRMGTAALLKANTAASADTTGGTTIAVRTIDAITSRTEFTVEDDTVELATGNIVSIGDQEAAASSGFRSYNQEMLGLDHLIVDDDDGLFGIDTTNAAWKAHVDDNGGTNRSLSPERMDAMFDGVYEKSGQRPDMIVCHQSFVREVKKLMESDVRYEPQTFKGGFERNLLVWNNGTKDVVFLADHLCMPNRAYFLSREHIKLAYLDKFGWLDEDGAVLSRVSNLANFEAAFGAMLEQIVTKRNAHGVLNDISINESTLVTPA